MKAVYYGKKYVKITDVRRINKLNYKTTNNIRQLDNASFTHTTIINTYPITHMLRGEKQKQQGVKNMGETLQRYKEYLCGKYRKKHTRDNYYNIAKRFIQYTNNNVNPETLQQWKIWAHNHYKKKNSLNSNINAVNLYLQYINHPEQLKTGQHEETDEYILTETEYNQILAQSRQNTETALIIQLLCHLLRPSEIINIKIKHRDHDVLYIEDTETSGKTGSGTIIMNDNLQDLWDKYLLIRPIPRSEYSEYLLIDNEPKWRGHKYKTTLPIRNRIQDIGRQTGLTKRVKPYTLKRTTISLMLDKESKYFTGDPKLVQIMARHKRLQTTMKYDRHDETYIRRYHKALNNITPKNEENISDEKIYTQHIDIVFPQNLNNKTDEGDNSSFSFSFSFELNGEIFLPILLIFPPEVNIFWFLSPQSTQQDSIRTGMVTT